MSRTLKKRKLQPAAQNLDATILKGLHPLVVEIGTLVPDEENLRLHDERNVDSIGNSLKRFKQRKPIVVQSDTRTVRAGNGTLAAAKRQGWTHIAAVIVEEDDVEATAYAIADNRTAELATWDYSSVAAIVEKYKLDPVEHALGFTADEIANITEGHTLEDEPEDPDPPEPVDYGALSARFMIPPFSVLNSREGWWRARRKMWLSLGIKSLEGRSDKLGDTMFSKVAYKTSVGKQQDSSFFDPVICELAFTWFSKVGAKVFDPFAGCSVSGMVAAALGREFEGMEIRPEQVSGNQKNWDANGAELAKFTEETVIPPTWICGDSAKMKTPKDVDMIFTCPPYSDLEVYSDDPGDISTAKDYTDFLLMYRKIVSKTVKRLKDNRFAFVVVGDIRDKKTGNYRNFVGDTVAAFREAGMHLYNEGILLTPIGSLSIRSGGVFSKTRKLGKAHQNILVFVKGSGPRAAQWCGDVKIVIPEVADE